MISCTLKPRGHRQSEPQTMNVRFEFSALDLNGRKRARYRLCLIHCSVRHTSQNGRVSLYLNKALRSPAPQAPCVKPPKNRRVDQSALWQVKAAQVCLDPAIRGIREIRRFRGRLTVGAAAAGSWSSTSRSASTAEPFELHAEDPDSSRVSGRRAAVQFASRSLPEMMLCRAERML